MGLRPWHRIKSKVQTRQGFGRDELFVSERIRKEHLRNYKERQDLIAMRQKLALGQMQADIANELHPDRRAAAHPNDMDITYCIDTEYIITTYYLCKEYAH